MDVITYRTELDDAGLNILVRENAIPYGGEDLKLNSPEKVAEFMRDTFRLGRMAEEYMYMLALDCKSHLVGVFEISHGTVNCSPVSPREIFIRALLCGAVSVILVHNHPSDDPSPSNEDAGVTKRISECGKLLEIKLLDHIIVGGGRFYSFREDSDVL